VKSVLLSNPYHARAEYLRNRYMPNRFMYKFHEDCQVGDWGIVIGSMPHNLYIFCEDEQVKLLPIADPQLPKKFWNKIYGQTVVIIQSKSSAIGYHAIAVIEEKDWEKLKPKPVPADNDEDRFNWESPQTEKEL
jgi:hypothetical protein